MNTSEAYFRMVQPTYLEAWPQALRSLSVAQVDVPLTRDQAISLGSQIYEFGSGFEAYLLSQHEDGGAIPTIREVLHHAIGLVGGRAFIRLGSRSPKDNFMGPEQPAENGNHAFDLLTKGASERISDDLHLALANDYAPHIFVRQFIDIPEWSEFRCFMRDRKLVGISQYFYHQRYSEIETDKDSIEWAIRDKFFPMFREASHLDNVVFDVTVKRRGGESTYGAREWQVKLIEINPMGPMTDPCLFCWDEPFDGSFRYVKPSPVCHWMRSCIGEIVEGIDV